MRRLSCLIGLLVMSVLAAGCGGKKEQASKDKGAAPQKKTPAPEDKTLEDKTLEDKTPENKTPPKGLSHENQQKTTGVVEPTPQTEEHKADSDGTPKATGKSGGGLKGLFGGITGARSAARRMSQMNNLKQVALAFHIHHDVYRRLPGAAIRSKDGKPLLSWRVKLLPFLEQQQLYDQFRLDEPWDSPHNKKLAANMPKVFESPLAPANNGTTRLVVITGKDRAFGGDQGPKFSQIVDGLSQTILALYAGTDKAVPWTKPADVEWQVGPPSKTLGKIGPEGIMLAFFDGSVQTLKADLSEESWKKLVDHKDGQPIDLSKE